MGMVNISWRVAIAIWLGIVWRAVAAVAALGLVATFALGDLLTSTPTITIATLCPIALVVQIWAVKCSVEHNLSKNRMMSLEPSAGLSTCPAGSQE